MDGARSARVRRASDQLKPSPGCRQDTSDLSLCSFLEKNLFELAEGGDLMELCAGDGLAAEIDGRPPVMDDGEEGYLPLPMLPPRASRSA